MPWFDVIIPIEDGAILKVRYVFGNNEADALNKAADIVREAILSVAEVKEAEAAENLREFMEDRRTDNDWPC